MRSCAIAKYVGVDFDADEVTIELHTGDAGGATTHSNIKTVSPSFV